MRYIWVYIEYHLHKIGLKKLYVKRGSIPYSTAFKGISKHFGFNKDIDSEVYINTVIKILMLLFCVFLCFHLILKIKHHNKYHYHNIQDTSIADLKAFSFLIDSGKERLAQGNIQGAYSEFILASNIQSNHQELQQLIIETLSILCTTNLEFCEALDKQLKCYM